MYKVFFLFTAFSVLCACRNEPLNSDTETQNRAILGIKDYEQILRHPVSLSSGIDSSNLAQIEFSALVDEFDTITAGEITKHKFTFKNIGSNTLYILDTKVSCGCTVVDFSEEGILPDEMAEIIVEFDSAGKSGSQEKKIIVISNSYPNETILTIQGFIKT